MEAERASEQQRKKKEEEKGEEKRNELSPFPHQPEIMRSGRVQHHSPRSLSLAQLEGREKQSPFLLETSQE